MATGATYFWEQPWDYVISELKTKKLGRIVAINVFGSSADALEECEKEWKKKFTEEMGTPKSWDVIQTDKVVTAIGKFGRNEIVRVFFDTQTAESIVNFEVVTTNSLIVWRPDMHAFSVVESLSGAYSDYIHPMPVEL